MSSRWASAFSFNLWLVLLIVSAGSLNNRWHHRWSSIDPLIYWPELSALWVLQQLTRRRAQHRTLHLSFCWSKITLTPPPPGTRDKMMECLFNGTISTEFGWRTTAALLLIFLLNDETFFTLSTKRLIKLQLVKTRNFPLTRVRLIQSHFHFLLQQMKQHEMICPSKYTAPVFSLVLTLYNTSTQILIENDEWGSCLNNIKLWKVKGSLLLLSRLQTGSDAENRFLCSEDKLVMLIIRHEYM